MSQDGGNEAEHDQGVAMPDRWSFYREHQPRLLRFVVRRVGEVKDAEEVCQESWEAFFSRYEVHMAAREPVKMLYAITSRDVIDFFRARGRTPLAVEGADLRDLAAAVGRHLDPYEPVIRKMDLERALARLTERRREVLCLRFLDDLSIEVTGLLMGITDHGVKQLQKRALAALRVMPGLDSYRTVATPQKGRK